MPQPIAVVSDHQDVQTRQRLPSPVADDAVSENPGNVSIHHPAYAKDESLLLSLPAYDTVQKEGQTKACLLFSFAQDACVIITQNRVAYLSKDKSRRGQPIPDGHPLEPGDYYLHVPNADSDDDTTDEYPVVRDFRDWPFDGCPEHWKMAVPPSLKSQGQRACSFTGRNFSIESAHIIPDSEDEWFNRNNMIAFSRRSGTSDARSRLTFNASNIIRLRSDIHHILDDHRFVFFPKRDADGELKLHFHSIERDDQIAADYHNRPINRDISDLSPEYFYARFGLEMFRLMRLVFLRQPKRRHLLVLRNGDLMAEWLDSKTILRYVSDRPRSTSPKKKKRNQEEKEQALEDEYEFNSCQTHPRRKRWKRDNDSGVSFGSDSFASEGDSDDYSRGRPRRRSRDVLI